MPRKSPYAIDLSKEEEASLNGVARKHTAPYRDVVRAKVVLMAAQGLENKDIAVRLDLPKKTVTKWRRRFFYEREKGLQDKPRQGRPFTFSP